MNQSGTKRRFTPRAGGERGAAGRAPAPRGPGGTQLLGFLFCPRRLRQVFQELNGLFLCPLPFSTIALLKFFSFPSFPQRTCFRCFNLASSGFRSRARAAGLITDLTLVQTFTMSKLFIFNHHFLQPLSSHLASFRTFPSSESAQNYLNYCNKSVYHHLSLFTLLTKPNHVSVACSPSVSKVKHLF